MTDYLDEDEYKTLLELSNSITIPHKSVYSFQNYKTDIGVDLSGVDLRDMLKRIIALENSKPEFIELKCKNCGGKIQQRYEDSIIKCPYCKSVYIIRRKQVNDDT